MNVSGAQTRDDVLAGLEAEDAGFAAEVRKAIFTFVHLPTRVTGRDVPKIIRIVDQPVLVTALAGAQGNQDLAASAEFLLSNMSQRMAQGLREEMAGRGRVKDKEAEEAMNIVINAVRELEAAGELSLVKEEE